MSKTYLGQLDKANDLVNGLEKNYDQVRGLGITAEQLIKLKEEIAEGRKLNDEVERLRTATHEAVARANQRLAEIKKTALNFKQIIKQNYDINRWPDFGIPDKR